MKVQIARVMHPIRRHREKGGSTLDKAYARGFVDGFLVTCNEGKGWSCSCLDDKCLHPEALAAALHPDALAMVEGSSNDEAVPGVR